MRPNPALSLVITIKKICKSKVTSSPWLISNLMHKILIYSHTIHLLKSSTCFEHYPAHLQEVYVVIVYMQPLVSSLSVGDCLVHRLTWYGHVQRMVEGRLPKIALKWMPKQKRPRGKLKKNWMEGIRKAMNERNLNEGQWEDGKQWSLGVGQRRKAF
jgi:hypothetical protein